MVEAALKAKDTAGADALIVVADTDAIPLTKRVNPAAGKDEQIDVEQWVTDTDDLISLAAGRLFHTDRAVVPLLLREQAPLDERNLERREEHTRHSQAAHGPQ